ncbi:SET domain-containing protein [Nocardia brasiliensis]
MSYTDFEIVTEELLPAGERGLVAKTAITAGTLIGIFDGEIRQFTLADGVFADTDMHKYTVQVHRAGDVLYGLVGTPPESFSGIDYINHSCAPNLTVQNRIVVVANRPIAVGERLTIDYRTWDFVREGQRCWCPTSTCVI